MPNINTDFINASDAPKIQAAHAQSLLAKKLEVCSFQNAVIAPYAKAGVWVNGKRLPQTLRHQMPTDKEKPPALPFFCDERVVFIGAFVPVWGHEITDNLKHLWFYFDESFEHLKNLKFAYVDFIDGKKSSQNFLELLKTLGLPLSQFLCVERPTQFSEVLVPDECFLCDLNIAACPSFASDNIDVMKFQRRFTKEYLNLLNHLPIIPQTKNIQKIYFSRAAFYSQKDFNEKEIEVFFANQGFTIIYPEKNTFLENLALLQNCETFASTDGSIAHNALFCKKAQQIIILRKCRYFSTYQCAANAIALQNNPQTEIVYIDAAFSPLANISKSWWSGPFFLYVTNNLRRFFNLPPQKNAFPIGQFCKCLVIDFIKSLPFYIDHKFLAWSHPLRAKWKIGTKLRRLFKHPR